MKAASIHSSHKQVHANVPTARHLPLRKPALGRNTKASPPTGWVVQAKLRVGLPRDPCEQEADRMADRVMRMSQPPAPEGEHTPNFRSTSPVVQKKCAACSSGGTPCPDCEKELRRQPGQHSGTGLGRMGAVGTGAPSVSPAVEARIKSRHGGGRSLPASERSFFESRMGTSFASTRIHTDAEASRLASRIQARAFTIGNDVFFANGEYHPNQAAGRHLLAHELTHVLQQTGASNAQDVTGRVPPPLVQRAAGDPVDVDFPVTDDEYENIQDWLARSEVGGTALTGVRDHDLDVMARSIFCSRLLFGGGLSDGDPLLCINNGITEADPRFAVVRGHVAAAVPAGCNQVQTASVDLVKLHGSSRDPAADLQFSHQVFAPCCVRFVQGGNVHQASEAQTKNWLGGDTDLQRTHSCSSVHPEESSLLTNATNEFHLNSRYVAFYVASMTPPLNGVNFSPDCGSGARAPFIRRLYISNSANSRTLSHELGHIPISGTQDHTTHGGGPNNLMIPNGPGSQLTASQCQQIRTNL